MSEADEWQPSCYDCGSKGSFPLFEVVIDHEEGMGYDWVPVPLCPGCKGRRHGYDCPRCGLTHSEKRDAKYCCERAPGEAPDCNECGRRMERGAWGYSPLLGPTVEWAECQCCPVAWGAFTGWHQTDDVPCKHVETDSRGDVR